jgi:N-acetylmuramoyl-L-alanine amidase
MINIAVKTAGDFIVEIKRVKVGADRAAGKCKPRALPWMFFRSLIAVCFLLFAAGCATPPPVAVKDTSRTFTTVVIDPGHGGKDSGTRSRARRGPVVLEKLAALDVGLRLDQKLRAYGFQTVMTRRTDVFIPLDDRARISNSQTNAIYVSIHFNDSPRRGIHGIETYYNSPQSIPLAEKIERKLDSIPGEGDRGVKYAGFRVLRKNQYPAVLVECGFLSNKNEAVRAASADYRQHLADMIAEAISEQRYGTSTPPKPGQSITATTGPAGTATGTGN